MQKKIIATLILGIAITGSTQVGAQSERALEARDSAQSRQETRVDPEVRKTENRERAEAKLSENRKKVCEKRQSNIKRIMTKMQTRGENQLEVFDKIADRTREFYAEKQNELPNYSDLDNAVIDKRRLAEETLLAGTSAIEDFDCTANDPVALKDAYKAQLGAQIDALKAYKTAVKDLIVGVKSAQSTNGPSSTTPDGEGGQP